jgi:hypothetical protein
MNEEVRLSARSGGRTIEGHFGEITEMVGTMSESLTSAGERCYLYEAEEDV